MARRKPTTVTHEAVPKTDSEGDDDDPAPRLDYLPGQHIHRGPDGRIHHEFSRVTVAGSPTKGSKSRVVLKDDIPPLASFEDGGPHLWSDDDTLAEEDGPVYDMVGKTRDPDERGPVAKEPRLTRASVR